MLKLLSKNRQWVFLVALSLTGIGLVWLATSKYGAGLAGDSIHYVSVAENLLKGRGFIDFAGNPLIFYPPLFPMLIAGLAWIFRVDVFTAGWVLNVLLWGLNIFLSGLVLMRVFQARPIYFYLSTLIVLFSSSALAMHASLLSDPIFLTITLFFFLVCESYIQRPGWRPFLAMLVLALLAPLLRYSGFAQIVAGGLIILYAHGRNLLKSLPLAGFFDVVSLLPTAAWIYFHNYLPYRTWWGTNNSYGADTQVNFLQSLRKIMYWFIPYRPISKDGFVEPVVALIAILIILLVINKLPNWLAWAREFLRPLWVSMLILSVVYYSSTILNIRTEDHKALFSDRYFVIILVPILALIFISFEYLILPHISPTRLQFFRIGLYLFFALWLFYPFFKDYKYLRASLVDGEAGYNEYNTRVFHESILITRVNALLQKEPDARLYSNIPPAVWFYTRHITLLPPAQDVPRTKDQIKKVFAGWPHDKPGYYIWFEPDPYELFMPLSDLGLVADMEMVENTSAGTIVRIWARGSR
jgi:hypothetical protein